jgi:Mrp family chromosome partitioning ATPase
MERLEIHPLVPDVAESLETALKARPAPPGFASRPVERAKPVPLPPWFIDRARRAYLSISYPPGGARIIGVTSALYGEGKTSLAIGIAMAIAADTLEPTLLLECDLEHPAFDRYFGFPATPGLADWLQGASPLRVIRAAVLDSEFIIPAGARATDPARLMYQLSESGLIEELRPRFRNIVIDLPPMLNIAYSSLACKLAERILLVARHGVTPIEDLEKAVFLLGQERLTGILLNGYSSKVPGWFRKLL